MTPEANLQNAPTGRLARRGPLSGVPARQIGAWRLSHRPPQPAWLVRAGTPIAIPGALLSGPGELLVLADAVDTPAGATAYDMGAAFTCIDLTGPACLEAIGLGAFAPLRPGDSLTTRLADIRVSIAGTADGLLLVMESFHADWLWTWLLDRLPLARS